MLVIKPVIDLGAPLGARHVDVLKSTQYSVVKSMVEFKIQESDLDLDLDLVKSFYGQDYDQGGD